MRKVGVASAVFFLVVFFGFGQAHASYTYNYVGSAFTEISNSTWGERVTATATFDAIANGTGNAPISWSISSGPVTITNSSAEGYTALSNFLGGEIVDWALAALQGSNAVLTFFDRSEGKPQDGVSMVYAEKPGTPYNRSIVEGTWTQASAPVPIPGAILLFAPGLLGMAAIRRKFKR